MRKRGSIPWGSGTHTSETGLPSLRIGGPVIWMRGMCVPRNRATRHSEIGLLSLGKSNHSPAVTGYTSLGKGEALHRTWGSRPQLRGTRPRENGGPVLGTAIPAPGNGVPVIRERGIYVHGKIGNPPYDEGDPVTRKRGTHSWQHRRPALGNGAGNP